MRVDIPELVFTASTQFFQYSLFAAATVDLSSFAKRDRSVSVTVFR